VESASAFFLPAESGRRFCLYYPGARGDGGPGVVYVHPFCEEMNKARRMAALQARRLSHMGYGVLQIDLHGCGDSTGEFADARWGIWKRDVQAALTWLGRRVRGPLGLWGLRLGATLAADVAHDPGHRVEQLLLWQPVSNGAQYLTQFLRLRLAAEMLAEGSAQAGVRGLREKLSQGVALEIAGYELHPRLAAAIDALVLADLVPAVKRVHCLEVTVQTEPKMSPASERFLNAWRLKGLEVHAAAVTGEPFWSTIEIAECEPLLAATERTLER
jgi:exosortase A-associated hydrolase 2